MIKIPVPCDADWQKMTPQSSGKFCSSCEKVVVDFSRMSDAEIKKYFITYSDQKTCGRFKASQVDRQLKTPRRNYFTVLSAAFSRIHVLRPMVFLMTGFFIWLGSCVKKQPPAMLGKPAYTDPDTSGQLMGEPMLFEDIDTSASLSHTDTIAYAQKDTIDYEKMIVGKIRIDTVNQHIKRRKK